MSGTDGADARQLFEVASRTHAGCVREQNEDHCASFQLNDSAGILVADGVSGERGGETASRTAIEVTLQALLDDEDTTRPERRLRQAVQRANITVHDLALKALELRGMATTLTAVVLEKDELYAAHVGDCRLYLFRAGRLLQLTNDHTVTGERVRAGILSKKRAQNHAAKSTLTRSLGRDLIAQVDLIRLRIVADDVFVLCSDGIHGLLDDAEIAGMCRTDSAESACQALIDAANRRGAPDNVSAAVARIIATPPANHKTRSLFDRLNPLRGR
jgi:serine/threonine protein phosphatase PrpC